MRVGCVHGVDRASTSLAGLVVRCVARGYLPFVNIFTFHGTLTGYPPAKRRRDDSHPNRERSKMQ